jgi:hypothetical protein
VSGSFVGGGSIVKTVTKDNILSGVFASAAAGIVADGGEGAGVGETGEAGEEDELGGYLSLICRYRLRYSEWTPISCSTSSSSVY